MRWNCHRCCLQFSALLLGSAHCVQKSENSFTGCSAREPCSVVVTQFSTVETRTVGTTRGTCVCCMSVDSRSGLGAKFAVAQRARHRTCLDIDRCVRTIGHVKFGGMIRKDIRSGTVPDSDEILRNDLHATGVARLVRKQCRSSILKTASHTPI